MSVYRKWFCNCNDQVKELSYEKVLEDEVLGEPFCERCGATPSSDPKHTIFYRDEELHED